MTLENFIVIVCLVLLILCRVGYRYASKNVYLRYQKQRKENRYEKFGKAS